jgi:hypothetical protein
VRASGWGRRLISQRLGFFVLFPILFGVAEVSLQRFAGEILTAQAESDGQAQRERNAGLEADETPQT